MATGILAILDDIAMLLDDTAVMAKLAAKKTAGLLGDDLAVNAEKATGMSSARELPAIWAITKGSFLNKLIILPCAFLLSTYIPWIILPILMCGACYLAYEGAEKIWEWLLHARKRQSITESKKPKKALTESQKIKSAIRTDFILSIEIIVIALETVIEQRFTIQLIVVSCIALVATVGVYGAVAMLVRLDDAGLYLIQSTNNSVSGKAKLIRHLGQFMVNLLPKIVRLLTVAGTIAMLLVAGGIFVHNLHWLHHLMAFLPALLADLTIGFIVGSALALILHYMPRTGEHSG